MRELPEAGNCECLLTEGTGIGMYDADIHACLPLLRDCCLQMRAFFAVLYLWLVRSWNCFSFMHEILDWADGAKEKNEKYDNSSCNPLCKKRSCKNRGASDQRSVLEPDANMPK